MQSVLLAVHLIVAVCIIGLVLLQQGKGATLGAATSSSASNSLFGSRGPASFLMKLTGCLAAVFFVTSLSIGHLISKQVHGASQLNSVVEQPVQVPTNSELPT